MNRKAIRESIQSELRWAPTATVATNDINTAINLEYQALCEQENWPFALQYTDETPLNVYADQQVDVTFTNGLHSATVSVTTDSSWIGTFVVDGDGVEWEISYATGTTIYLVTAWTGSSGTQTDLWIRYRQYRFPRDLVEVLDMTANPLGSNEIISMLFVSGTENAAWPLYRNTSGGRPGCWLLRPTVTQQAPIAQPTAAVAAGGSLSLVARRYVYTHVVAGRESAPSLITTAVTPAGLNLSILISAVEVLFAGATRNFYVEVGGTGVFNYLGSTLVSAFTSYLDDGSATPDVTRRLSLESTWRYFMVRPYPGQTYQVTMRYFKRLPPLSAETDVPAFDSAWHDVIVWRVVCRFLGRPGQDGKLLDHANKRLGERFNAMCSALLGDRIRKSPRLWTAQNRNTGRFVPKTYPPTLS